MRVVSQSLALCVVLSAGSSSAAAASFAASAPLKTLHDHVPAAVQHLSPIATVPATNRLNLAIGLSLRDSAGLDALLQKLYDPASRHYRQFLTPEQFTERFGPTAREYQAVIDFAIRNGLTVTATHGNRMLLDVNGSVADIQRAFRITLHVYRHPRENRNFYAPDVEPSVSASLPIADIEGLNNYVLPRPMNLKEKPGGNGNRFAVASGSGPGGAFSGNDFRDAYLPGVTLTGTGQSVGLLEFDGYYARDISAYESAAGLSPVTLQNVLLDGFNGAPTAGPNSGDGEVSLDIEMAIAMAPGLSRVVVFEAGPNGLQNDVLNTMAANTQVSQFSCSWGWGGGPNTTTDNIFKQMAAQGQTFFEASGDTDAFTTGSNSANGVDNSSLQNAPSSCPYITVVGGTTLTTTGPHGSWLSEAVWNWGSQNGVYTGSSGGISSYYSIPGWQKGVNMTAAGGSQSFRNIPDVALAADNIYVAYGNGTSGTFGGTSCAAPLWAGLAALMNEQALTLGRSAVGFINSAIYALAEGSGYSASFHDITSGNNEWSVSPNAFTAVAGYDLCTGWGTPAGQSLINALAGPPDSLRISPAAVFDSVGLEGGPFNPTSDVFQLSNSGTTAVTWSVLGKPAWLDVSLAGGALSGGESTSVTASLSAAANSLSAGTYTASLVFSNATTHVAQSFPVTLEVELSLVQNGGFETGDFTGWTLVGNSTISSRRGTTIYNAVESSGQYPAVVHSGNYGAFLGDTQIATLSQILATVPGETYLLSFWLDNTNSGSNQQFHLTWNGSILYSLLNPPAIGWTNLQFMVTANADNTLLQFGAENDPAYFGLDDVSVTRVPPLTIEAVNNTGGTIDLSWSAATGLVYQVQYKTNLLQPNWLDLGPPIVATHGKLNLSDTMSSPQRFYRIILLP